jgi:hypothetical protein
MHAQDGAAVTSADRRPGTAARTLCSAARASQPSLQTFERAVLYIDGSSVVLEDSHPLVVLVAAEGGSTAPLFARSTRADLT